MKYNRWLFAFISILGMTWVLAYASTPQLYQQLFQVKDYLNEEQLDSAESVLSNIEGSCLNSDNDTLRMLFNETKGQLLFHRHDYGEALVSFKNTYLLYEKINLKDVNYIEAFLAIGVCHERLGDLVEAERYYRMGLLRSVFISNSREYQRSFYLNLGNLYKNCGDSILAVECFKRIDANDFGGLIDASAEDLINEEELRILNLRKSGDFDAALVAYDTLIRRAKEIIGTHNDDYARLVYSKALVLGFDLGRISEAKQLYKEVMALAPYLGANNENVKDSRNGYLQALAYEGNEEELTQLIPQAVAECEAYPDTNIELALLYRLTGNGAYWNQNYAIAIPYYEKYVALSLSNEGRSTIEIPNMLALCYFHAHTPAKVISLLERVFKTHKSLVEANEDIKSQLLHNYGRALMLVGKRKKAIRPLEQSLEIFMRLTGETNPKTAGFLQECRKQY